MKLSLVIATYNRSASLLRTMRSVVVQSAAPHDWECVVVNNNSADSTAADFAAFAAAHPSLNLRMVDEPAQGLSNARNRGIAESQGEIIAIVDDDETIVPDYIAACIGFFDSSDVLAAGGGVVAAYDTARPRWMSLYPERIVANPIDLGKRMCAFPANRVPAGGNMILRKEAFARYGCFDPALGRNGKQLTGGEETELFARLRAAGHTLYYIPEATIFHHIPDSKLTRGYFARLCFDVGRSKYVRASLHGGVPMLFAAETAKCAATLALALFYTLTFRPSKATYLCLMRYNIVKGIFAVA